MKKINTCFLAIACLLLFSCKKDTTNIALQSSSSEKVFLPAAGEAKWQGEFTSYQGFPSTHAVADRLFIHDGYARIYSDSVNISIHNYYSTKIWLEIPDSINLSADSLNFEVGVKNPFNSAFYSPYYGRDITLYLKGETNQAFINNVATDDINPDVHKRAAIGIGQTIQNDITELQHNCEDYDTLILQTYNGGVKAYRNNEFLRGLGYEGEPRIGRLKELGVIFKGSGYIDYIKVFRSVHGKLLMSEHFNVDGKSTIKIWY